MQLRTWSHSNHRALPTVWAYATLGMTRTYLFEEFADFASQSTLDNYNQQDIDNENQLKKEISEENDELAVPAESDKIKAES